MRQAFVCHAAMVDNEFGSLIQEGVEVKGEHRASADFNTAGAFGGLAELESDQSFNGRGFFINRLNNVGTFNGNVRAYGDILSALGLAYRDRAFGKKRFSLIDFGSWNNKFEGKNTREILKLFQCVAKIVAVDGVHFSVLFLTIFWCGY